MAIRKFFIRFLCAALPLLLATACASVSAPDGRTGNIPPATPPADRFEALNEKRDPITRVRLGRDVLVPQPVKEDQMPDVIVGPYELRGETLASALQLIMDDYDVSLAFESELGLTRRITVSNLHGKMKDVVNRICSLADLYCHYEAGALTIKATETFVVDLPPISTSSTAGATTAAATTGATGTATGATTGTTATGFSSEAYTQIAAGLAAVIGGEPPVVDTSTRVMIYTATQRTQKYALKYFERLRKNTALIIFETHIWEVALNNSNRTGINWSPLFKRVGSFGLDIQLPGGAPLGAATPISITPTYTGSSGDITSEAVLEFISEHGSVKTVSQPQITVLSGSSASLSVSQEENYVSAVTQTPSTVIGAPPTFSNTTDTVESGLTMNVTSAWDQSTVYGTLNIELNDLLDIEEFPLGEGSSVQLPKMTTRSLQTAIRVRPGDAILIGGLVSEKDNFSESGPGFMKPLFATSREVTKTNTELVFLLRPRVVAFIVGDDKDTPAVAEAPGEGIASPDITEHVRGLFGRAGAASPIEMESRTALPSGISPEAFAPQAPSGAAPIVIIPEEDLPASLQYESAPVVLTPLPEDEDEDNQKSDGDRR